MTAQKTVDTQLLTIEEVAGRLKLGTTTVYELINDGEIRVIDVARAGSQRPKLRISESELAAFQKRRTLDIPKRRRPRAA